MDEFISSLEIRGFRTLSSLDIPNLGKVNLITGRNNSGKSSLLEAIRLLASGGALRTIQDILSYRDEINYVSSAEADRTWLPTDLVPFCNLFTGFPDLASCDTGFSVVASGSIPAPLRSLAAKIGWFTRHIEPERGGVSYAEATTDLFGETEGFPAFALEMGERRRVIPIERIQRRIASRMETVAEPPFRCVYLDPFSSRSTSQMGALWDAIALTDVEPEIVRALQIVSKDILAVSLVGGDDRPRGRTAIARSSTHDSPIPLRTFGDGVNRLFGIVLSLCNAGNGILLVDEIENGLHYSAQTEIWRAIFRLANALNVQVFATSHSWDCVRAFQEAASESPDDGALIRLSRRGDRIIATSFSEEELLVATRDQIEVR